MLLIVVIQTIFARHFISSKDQYEFANGDHLGKKFDG